jgi:hypothetical protein
MTVIMYLPEQAYSLLLSDSLIGNMFWLAGKPNLPIVFSCKKLPRRATKRLITTSVFKSNPLARRGQPPVLVVCGQGQHDRRDDQEPYPLKCVARGVLGRLPLTNLVPARYWKPPTEVATKRLRSTKRPPAQ